MSAATAVRRGRRKIEALMVDECVIRRYDPTTQRTAANFDEETLQYAADAGVVVYSGKCRVQVRSDINANAVEGVVAEHEGTYRTATVQLPIEGSADVVSDCVLEITASPLDPARVGLLLNLQADTKSKTHATHRRFRAREVLS